MSTAMQTESRNTGYPGTRCRWPDRLPTRALPAFSTHRRRANVRPSPAGGANPNELLSASGLHTATPLRVRLEAPSPAQVLRKTTSAFNSILPQNLIQRYVVSQDAWGNLLPSSSDGISGGFPYRFVGALGVRADLTTSLIYMRARWYDGIGLQRFISRVPLANDALLVIRE